MEFFNEDFRFTSRTVAELDQIALQGGEVGNLDDRCQTVCAETPKSPVGDWSARWIRTGGVGNRGLMILVALSPRSRRLLREGKIRAWAALGLTRNQAEVIYDLNVPYKHEMIEALVQVLRNRSMISAFRAHPGEFGPGTGRREWNRRWARRFNLSFSAPRETALALMVKAIA